MPKKIADEKISILVDKVADFSFTGEKLKFCLSHALFSSFDVDTGTRLLLKTIAQNIDFESIAKVKDIGAGAGIIGICLKKKHPHIDVTFTDRDMLALDFTKLNAGLNDIAGCRFSGELGIKSTDLKYDFIVSNVPAKIGDKGLEDLLKKMLSSHSRGGLCAIVVIKPLEAKIKEILAAACAVIKFKEAGKTHTVFHFSAPENPVGTPASAAALSPYIRGDAVHNNFGFSYRLKTVYNLPDFDTLGYQSGLLAGLLVDEKLCGACLFWNPMQGHVPVIMHKKFSGKITKYILAGRDLLQLEITRDNLMQNGVQDEKILTRHVSLISEVAEEVQNYIIIPDVIPMTNGYDITLKDLPPANVFVSDKSANIFRLLENQKTHRIKKKIKKNGFTAVGL